MKKILVLTLIAFLLMISCSEEDNTNSVSDADIIDYDDDDEDIVNTLCGNGYLEDIEVCDFKSDMKYCDEISSKYIGGRSKCKEDCSGWDVTNCIEGETWTDPDTGFIWSGRSKEKYTFAGASGYCRNLKKGVYSDWWLPRISELRTLLQNCPEVETGGDCNIDENDCLDWDCRNEACWGCSVKNDGSNSKLGDVCLLWSSSRYDDTEEYVWAIIFGFGNVVGHFKEKYDYARCVHLPIL